MAGGGGDTTGDLEAQLRAPLSTHHCAHPVRGRWSHRVVVGVGSRGVHTAITAQVERKHQQHGQGMPGNMLNLMLDQDILVCDVKAWIIQLT